MDNPTVLGEAAINLIKMLLLQPGRFGYENLANLLHKQCDQLNYWDFKRALLHYLVYALPRGPVTQALKTQLPDAVLMFYRHHNDDVITDALVLRTCKRVVDSLTTEDGENPANLFSMFLAQGNPLVLVILLLKVALFCPHVQSHLELRIASLIRYYETYSEDDCRWVINFFEVFRVTFTVYASGTMYNLVRIGDGDVTASTLSTYRIFSQLRDQPIEFDSMSDSSPQDALIAEDLSQPSQLPAEVTNISSHSMPSAMAS